MPPQQRELTAKEVIDATIAAAAAYRAMQPEQRKQLDRELKEREVNQHVYSEQVGGRPDSEIVRDFKTLTDQASQLVRTYEEMAKRAVSATEVDAIASQLRVLGGQIQENDSLRVELSGVPMQHLEDRQVRRPSLMGRAARGTAFEPLARSAGVRTRPVLVETDTTVTRSVEPESYDVSAARGEIETTESALHRMREQAPATILGPDGRPLTRGVEAGPAKRILGPDGKTIGETASVAAQEFVKGDIRSAREAVANIADSRAADSGMPSRALEHAAEDIDTETLVKQHAPEGVDSDVVSRSSRVSDLVSGVKGDASRGAIRSVEAGLGAVEEEIDTVASAERRADSAVRDARALRASGQVDAAAQRLQEVTEDVSGETQEKTAEVMAQVDDAQVKRSELLLNNMTPGLLTGKESPAMTVGLAETAEVLNHPKQKMSHHLLLSDLGTVKSIAEEGGVHPMAVVGASIQVSSQMSAAGGEHYPSEVLKANRAEVKAAAAQLNEDLNRRIKSEMAMGGGRPRTSEDWLKWLDEAVVGDERQDARRAA